jgi:hypothetical protein
VTLAFFIIIYIIPETLIIDNEALKVLPGNYFINEAEFLNVDASERLATDFFKEYKT